MITTYQLEQGIAAFKANRREQAYRIFAALASADPHDEDAWLWKAAAAPSVEESITDLTTVLSLNPASRRARAGLAWAYQQRAQQPAPPPEPGPAVPPPAYMQSPTPLLADRPVLPHGAAPSAPAPSRAPQSRARPARQAGPFLPRLTRWTSSLLGLSPVQGRRVLQGAFIGGAVTASLSGLVGVLLALVSIGRITPVGLAVLAALLTWVLTVLWGGYVGALAGLFLPLAPACWRHRGLVSAGSGRQTWIRLAALISLGISLAGAVLGAGASFLALPVVELLALYPVGLAGSAAAAGLALLTIRYIARTQFFDLARWRALPMVEKLLAGIPVALGGLVIGSAIAAVIAGTCGVLLVLLAIALLVSGESLFSGLTRTGTRVVWTAAQRPRRQPLPAPPQQPQPVEPPPLPPELLEELTNPPLPAVPQAAPRQPTLLFADDFGDNRHNWPTGPWVSLKDGALSILYTGPSIFWIVYRRLTVQNGILEATGSYAEGRKDQGWGVVFRLLDGDNRYEFVVSANGHYRCGKAVAGQWCDLVPWRSLPRPLRPGQQITLKVIYEGPQIALYVNGQHLGTVTDGDLGQGYVGLIAYKDVHARFHSFRVWS